MKIIFSIKDQNTIKIRLEDKKRGVYEEALTISRDFDILLIRTIDKFLHGDIIGRLSLKNLEIQGKVEEKALWGMVLGAVSSALKC